jgi:hypothetical protein
MQVASSAQEVLLVQSRSQRLSAVQRIGPVLQAPAPLQPIAHWSPASHSTELAQELAPTQSSSQEAVLEVQLSGPRQESSPLQASRQGPSDWQLTVPWQEPLLPQSIEAIS